MRILLTEKQSTIRELNRSLRGKIRSKWIHYAANQVDRLGANGVVPLAANIVAPLSANELAPYWCQSTVAPIIKVEICETEKSLNDHRLKSLGFNSTLNDRPPIPLATLNDFLKEPGLIDKTSEEDNHKVITSLSAHVEKIYYMADMILELYTNQSPHFVYIGYIKKLELYSHHVLALNNRSKMERTLLLRESIIEKMAFINEVKKIS